MAGFTEDANGFLSTVNPGEPTVLQRLLQAQFNDTGITLANDASGGTASSLMDELDGMDGTGWTTQQRLVKSPAAIVVEEHAINDELGGETVADYSGYLGQWIQDVRAAGKTPVLEEPGPVCDGNHPQLPQYVAAMDEAAAQYGVALVQQYQYISNSTGWCSHMAGGYYPDAYIDALKAKQEQAVIAPLVKTLIGS